MPRIIRRRPLKERVQAMLNPMDFLLWLSEELETREWDSASAGTPIGLALNAMFLIGRANYSQRSSHDDLFGDEESSGWVSALVYLVVWSTGIFSFLNSFQAITRTRKYRLFQADVEKETAPPAPATRRVHVDSSPASSSPFRMISEALLPESAESRAHPDKARDVWELSIWDPLPISLRLFCLFNPGSVLVYLIALPITSLDPQPSVTVFFAILTQLALSGMLLLLCDLFTKQAKSNAVIQKEVMREYNAKFVHPRLNPVVRDVGTQLSALQPKGKQHSVETGVPTTLIRRSYATQSSPASTPTVERGTPSATHQTNILQPQLFTPTNPSRRDSLAQSIQQRPSTARQSLPASYNPVASTPHVPSPQPAPSNFTPAQESPYANYGKQHLGVYSHNKSPLKKATSLSNFDAPGASTASPRNSREMAALEQRSWGRPASPTKHAAAAPARHSSGSGTNGGGSFAHLARQQWQQERYPSRW